MEVSRNGWELEDLNYRGAGKGLPILVDKTVLDASRAEGMKDFVKYRVKRGISRNFRWRLRKVWRPELVEACERRRPTRISIF